jgi:hypothetical protein
METVFGWSSFFLYFCTLKSDMANIHKIRYISDHNTANNNQKNKK